MRAALEAWLAARAKAPPPPQMRAVIHEHKGRRNQVPGKPRYVVRAEPASARSPRYQGRKIARNAPCPCGSGVKFKRCCHP